MGVNTLEQSRIKADIQMVSGETEIHINDILRNANSQRGHNSQLSTLYCHTEKKNYYGPIDW